MIWPWSFILYFAGNIYNVRAILIVWSYQLFCYLSRFRSCYGCKRGFYNANTCFFTGGRWMQRDALRVYDWWRLTGCGHAPSDGKGSRSPFFLWVVSVLAPATLHRTVPALLTHRPPHTLPQQTVSSTQSTLWWLSACRTLPTWMLR